MVGHVSRGKLSVPEIPSQYEGGGVRGYVDQLRFKRETSSHGVASTATDYTSSQYRVIGGWSPGETNTGNASAAASLVQGLLHPSGQKSGMGIQ